VLGKVDGWKKEENGKGVLRWDGWGKVGLGTGVSGNGGERSKAGGEVRRRRRVR